MSRVFSEHLEYLTLPGRRDYFSQAISNVLRPGDTVADLGCGFGILGMLCLEAGASHVWGIDASDAIEIARESLRRAGLAQHYTFIRGSTFEIDLPEKVDVLVCDHVGYFGFDYGIVGMLADARRRFLKQGGRIVPRRIRLIMAGVASPACRTKADAWSGCAVPEEYRWLQDTAVNTKYPVSLNDTEICTQPVILGEIDLTRDNPESLAFEISLEALRNDRCDGLVGWFECELAEGVWMTNSPLSQDSIGRSQAFLPAREPFDLKTGDQVLVTIRFRFDPELIAWTIKTPGNAPRQKLSTWASTLLTAADLSVPSPRPVSLNNVGSAKQALLALVDSKRSAQEIEDFLIHRDPPLFPTAAETRRFVRRELARDTQT